MESPKSFGQALGRTGDLLRGLTLPQQLMLALGALAVAATLWVFVGWMSKPKFVTLYSGLSPQDAQELGGRLAAANIAYALSPDGTAVTVPSDQVDGAPLKTASPGL